MPEQEQGPGDGPGRRLGLQEGSELHKAVKLYKAPPNPKP